VPPGAALVLPETFTVMVVVESEPAGLIAEPPLGVVGSEVGGVITVVEAEGFVVPGVITAGVALPGNFGTGGLVTVIAIDAEPPAVVVPEAAGVVAAGAASVLPRRRRSSLSESLSDDVLFFFFVLSRPVLPVKPATSTATCVVTFKLVNS